MKDYAGSRTLRKKHSKTYTDGMSSSDEEEDMTTTYNPEEKIKSKEFPPYFVCEMKGEDVTFEYFQRTGFNMPIFVREKTGLHLRVPDPAFSVTDVKNFVGGRRLLEVMNCATQLNAEMTLKDFEEFFTSPDRDDTKLNVISLEFSHTRLDSHVVAPRVVRQIDFTDNVWPRHLKDMQDESTNDLSKMLYPKVQKYCLMSIAGCYTDFHVDLGGTSVWYHLLRGQKFFWLIPPTPANLKAFENWTFSGKQGDVFFGDMVEKCGRVILNPGNTFFIPSGWIHAVYTPVDSLVFGGNYLHPFAIERQLKICMLEETLKVPQKFRFPYLAEMLWYVLDKYCYALLGRHHLDLPAHVLHRLLGTEEERKAFQENIGHPHLTPGEVRGLKAIVLYLHSLAVNKKGVPAYIKDPVALLRDIRIIVEVHKNDRPERAVNGRPLLFWPGIKQESSWFMKGKKTAEIERDPAKRFEADGKMFLDTELLCSICGLDGWYSLPGQSSFDRNKITNSLTECVICHELTHSICWADFGADCVTEESLPNAWKCGRCVRFPPVAKPPPPPPQLAPTSPPQIKEEVKDSDQSGFDLNNVKAEPQEPDSTPMDTDENGEQDLGIMHTEDFVVKEEPVGGGEGNAGFVAPAPCDIKTELMEAVGGVDTSRRTSNLAYKVGLFFQRYADRFRYANDLYRVPEPDRLGVLVYESTLLASVFQYLSTLELVACRSVCRAWWRVTREMSTLADCGNRVDLSGMKVTAHMVQVVAAKRPQQLILDWTNVSKQQLSWLLPRISSTTGLSLIGLEYGSQVSALNMLPSPNLLALDLSFVSNLNDSALNKLLVRSDEKKWNLANLKSLKLRSTDISDVAVRYICQSLPQLTTLSLSNCLRVGDMGLAQLGDSPLTNVIRQLDISHCSAVTDTGLSHLWRCGGLRWLNVERTGITDSGVESFLRGRPAMAFRTGVIFASQ